MSINPVNVETNTPSDLTVGSSSQEGTATSLALSDHEHGLPPFGSGSGEFCEGNDARLGSSLDQVAFTATNASYTVPAGFKVVGAWIRPGSGGGAGGGAGAQGGTVTNRGGGGGAGGGCGSSATLQYAPIVAPAGDVLNVTIGSGGTGGTGGVFGGSSAGNGGAGGDSTITNTSTSTLLIRASNQYIGAIGVAQAGSAATSVSGGSISTALAYKWGPAYWVSASVGVGSAAPTAGAAAGAVSSNGSSASTVGTAAPAGYFGGSYVTAAVAGQGGTASGTMSGGGAGGTGASAGTGDEYVSALGLSIPPTSGSGSGKAGCRSTTEGTGGSGNNGGAGFAGNNGGAGQSGSLGRGGGGGQGGGGGGCGSAGDTSNAGSGGNGGAGGDGSNGAVILVLARA